jgi:hypothetical protein
VQNDAQHAQGNDLKKFLRHSTNKHTQKEEKEHTTNIEKKGTFFEAKINTLEPQVDRD